MCISHYAREISLGPIYVQVQCHNRVIDIPYLNVTLVLVRMHNSSSLYSHGGNHVNLLCGPL